jgi:hypothetical protein
MISRTDVKCVSKIAPVHACEQLQALQHSKLQEHGNTEQVQTVRSLDSNRYR